MLKSVWKTVLATLVIVIAMNTAQAGDIPWGEDKGTSDLPAIFRDRSAKQRLMAEEVARQDGKAEAKPDGESRHSAGDSLAARARRIQKGRDGNGE